MNQPNNWHVLIIESLPAQEVEEFLSLTAFLDNAGICYDYHRVQNREELHEIIAHQIFLQQCCHKATQFMHLSCHGDKDGICLSGGVFLPWEQLADDLRPLHNVCPGGLGVCLASCFGAYGIKMAQVLSPIQVPFTWLIGSRKPLRVREICVGFPVLYNYFLRGESTETSMALLQQIFRDYELQMNSGRTTQQIYSSAFWIAFREWHHRVIFGSAVMPQPYRSQYQMSSTTALLERSSAPS